MVDSPRRMLSKEKLRTGATLSALLFALFLSALDFSIVTTAIPTISYQLHTQTAYVWIGSSYLLTSAAVAPVWGKVSDIWGRKRALLCAIAIFFIGSAICGWSRSIAQLIVGRSVQGSAAGGIIVLVNITISDLWSPRYRSFFLTTTGLVWALSAGVGPLLGGVFSQYLTWRWIFWVNLPCSLVAFGILLAVLQPAQTPAAQSERGKSMDWPGAIAIVGLSVMILLSLDSGGVVSPWDSPKVLGLLLGGVATLMGFIFWEIKFASNPLIPPRLLDGLSKTSPLVVCFAHGFVNVSSWYFLPLYFQAVRGASPTYSGVLIMPIVVVQACVGLAAGAIMFRYGWIKPLVWGGMGLMTLGFGLFISLGASASMPTTVVIEIIAALGVGCAFQAPLIAYQSAIGASDVAVGTALFGFIRSLSTSISVVIGGIVFQNGMESQRRSLVDVLGPDLAQNFSASAAAANVLIIRTLPLGQQEIIKHAYTFSLKNMWTMYTSVGGLGLIAALFVKHQPLTATTDNSAAETESAELQDLPTTPSAQLPISGQAVLLQATSPSLSQDTTPTNHTQAIRYIPRKVSSTPPIA